MTPKETDHLIPLQQQSNSLIDDDTVVVIEHDEQRQYNYKHNNYVQSQCKGDIDDSTRNDSIIIKALLICTMIVLVLHMIFFQYQHNLMKHDTLLSPNPAAKTTNNITDTVTVTATDTYKMGPYTIITEVQEGTDFWSYYNFYEGNDTLGSAGYNTYVNRSYAQQHSLIQTILPSSHDDDDDRRPINIMKSKATLAGPRESIRIEGTTRFTSNVGGLFILDVDHIPAGCGQWPAFWLTDSDHWPYHGEIDIVEGINIQSYVKTALHTTSECSMYAHVPSYKMTGIWDRATGIPDTYTGIMDYNTSLPADNCYVMTPHQWMNQGCVIQSTDDNTIGIGINNPSHSYDANDDDTNNNQKKSKTKTKRSGAIYVLQWDPIVTNSIQSYVFLKSEPNLIPQNLLDSLQYASYVNNKNNDNTMDESIIPKDVYPDPQGWINNVTNQTILPYAYFAIGNSTGCTANHFDHMNVIFNLAFCGNVAGNRFINDCGTKLGLQNIKTTSSNPIQACNDYIQSNPKELEDAYWAIRGLYIYERS